MATRRRIGVSVATTEAARRQLMMPVACWEKKWVTPENAPTNSSMKIFKWVQTEKKQQFSDDEGEVDEPLAPLPDEPEVVEGDEEMDQDEPTQSVAPENDIATQDVNSVVQEVPSEPQTKPPSPAPPALSLQPTDSVLTTEEAADAFDAALQPLEADMTIDIGMDITAPPEEVENIDMGALGPDGTSYESVHDLNQIEENDAVLGGPLMDNTVDPFAETLETEAITGQTTEEDNPS
ncbi:hypothetical protein BJ138DRAFT_999311 [Hygrophoropsis aurantiaca]|uniref:Uncharacterized protein n=1 Tax=Hygrophoropsis aurantiaca TaxID=72124 RepID=A0ACB8AN13_9AGAM|nr:hypothetical protein BJ138DRAFT_999311 [Hygrophoropsis aurantiaca]